VAWCRREMTPTVSIAFPTFNGARYIGDTIESVLSQTEVKSDRHELARGIRELGRLLLEGPNDDGRQADRGDEDPDEATKRRELPASRCVRNHRPVTCPRDRRPSARRRATLRSRSGARARDDSLLLGIRLGPTLSPP
jgi:hypothetical protein